MTATRIVMADFPGWPVSGQELDFEDHQNFVNETVDRITSLPTDYSSHTNEVMVVNDSSGGPTIVSTAAEARFALKAVRRFRPHIVATAASDAITDNEHMGSIIMMTNGSPATLSLSLSGDPNTGVSSPFRCEIRRAHGSSTVTLSLGGGLTNRNPNSHLSVLIERGITVTIYGTDVYIDGYSSA